MTKLSTVRDRASAVDTTAICDADKSTRVMSSALRCRSRNPAMCGPAYTVRCRGDFFGVLCGVESASSGDVLVVDGGGAEIAFAGELFARAAELRGLAGIIVDGGYRDMNYVASCEFPIFSRHVTPMAGTTWRLGELQVAISCGGVSVAPGDIIIADEEGIVVLDPLSAESVLDAALEIKVTEARVIKSLSEGHRLTECINVEEHSKLLAEGRPSVMRFTV